MTTPKSAVVQPYLFFGGRCEEAVEFYRTALRAEVDMLLRHKDRYGLGWMVSIPETI